MKTFFSKFSTAFFAIALLALCSIFVSASPPPQIQTKMEKSAVNILVIGTPSVGTIAAITAQMEQHGIEAVFVARCDGDALTALGEPIPIIANKHDIIPIATAAEIESLIQLKTETPKSVSSNFSPQEFYDVPPDIRGFNGQSFANPIRARPQNA